MKIPKIELQFAKSQRAQKPEKDAMQMGLADFRDSKQKSTARKEKIQKRIKAEEAKINMEELEHDERSEHYERPTQEIEGESEAEGGVKRVREETEGEVGGMGGQENSEEEPNGYPSNCQDVHKMRAVSPQHCSCYNCFLG